MNFILDDHPLLEIKARMIHHTQPSFWNTYKYLPREIQKLADEQYELLKKDPSHNSLRFKKARGKQVWSVRVSKGYRALAYDVPGGLVWFWIGTHAEYDSRLG